MTEAPTQRGPSRWWYAPAALAFLVLSAGVPVWFLVSTLSVLSSGEEFVAPGSRSMELEQPGKYVVWDSVRNAGEEASFAMATYLPANLGVRIVDEAAGTEVAASVGTRATETFGGATRQSICDFTAPHRGRYTLSVTNLPTQRIFLVRQAVKPPLLRNFLVCAICTLAGWLAPVVTLIIVESGRIRHARMPGLPPPPQ